MHYKYTTINHNNKKSKLQNVPHTFRSTAMKVCLDSNSLSRHLCVLFPQSSILGIRVRQRPQNIVLSREVLLDQRNCFRMFAELFVK